MSEIELPKQGLFATPQQPKPKRLLKKRPRQPVKIVCLRCKPSPTPWIPSWDDEEEARCPRCKKIYKMWHGRMIEEGTIVAMPGNLRNRYQLVYRDSEGETGIKNFVANRGFTFPKDHLITLVYSRGRLVEIVNQTELKPDRVYIGATRPRGPLLITTLLMLAYVIWFGNNTWNSLKENDNWSLLSHSWGLAALGVAILLGLLPAVAYLLTPPPDLSEEE